MIRIVFDDGSIIDCDHIAKIFIEENDHDEKLTIVGCISNMGKEDNNE